MIPATSFKGEDVAVMGLGRSGLTAARALAMGGANVLAWDDDEERRRAAAAQGVELTNLEDADFGGVAVLVLSPGIPHTFPAPHPVAARAIAAGRDIICDVELLVREIAEATYLGVTGTNGKSTTTALIGHLFETAGRQAQVGGNIGAPVLELEVLGAEGTYVLELSSYQLERTPSLRLDISVLLNLSPDHLDRHGDMDGYVAAKMHIFDNARDGAHAIVGMDDGAGRGIALDLMLRGGLKIVPISGSQRVAGGSYADEDGWLVDDLDNGQTRILDLSTVPTLPGRHNWQNAAAAFAAARVAGIDATAAARGIACFPGLKHRQERVRVIGNVVYVNDSKATNMAAAANALACYENIHWIAGGRAKEADMSALAPYFDRVRHAYLIGEAAAAFAGGLEGRVPATPCGDLAGAVTAAHAAAQADGRGVVLLSPACASFDQFTDFEDRGRAFAELVEALP